MTENEYKTLIDTYGVHPSRWPEDKRAPALEFAYKNPVQVKQLNANAAFLDKIIDTATLPDTHADTQNGLLSARILKAAQTTQQKPRQKIETPANDHPTKFLADDEVRIPIARWKYLAATLLITMGIGFGLGQSVIGQSDYWTAETLYSYNIDAEYSTSEWLEAQE